jgi:DNA-directed RNA polymerase subunit E'/Rpb7
MIEDIIITEQITVPPNFINADLLQTIESLFQEKVIDRCNDETGYIMELISIITIKGGNIVGDHGNVVYQVTAKVKTFKVEKDEYLKAIVYKVDAKDLFAQAGPFRIYVSATKIAPRYTYQNGKYVSDSDTIELNKPVSIKVIGKKLTGINKMIVGTIV